jgi:MFS family permease
VRGRAMLGGVALGVTAGWNLANVGAVAESAGRAYGVGLAVVGLFTTSLFVTHALLQVPAGRLCDRIGARVVGGTGLLIVAGASAALLTWREPWFAIGMRAIVGVGTAAAFVSGSDYIRKSIGTPFAQGLFGACSVGAVGLALALVPLWGTWQAPFATAVIVALAGLVLVAQAPSEPVRPAPLRVLPKVADRRLLPLAAMHSASFGLSVIIGNWVVTLLHRAGGDSKHVSGIAGGLTLFAGIVSRPLGGRLAGRFGVLRLSFLVGGGAVAVLAIAKPLPLAIAAAAVVGFAAGLPFAPCFAAAARLVPEAPGAAIGMVNMFAAVTILVGTPLAGLTFSLPGNGRIGFLVIAVLWAATAFAVPRATRARA